MKPAITGREAAEDEELLVHDWRVARLAQFGIPQSRPRQAPLLEPAPQGVSAETGTPPDTPTRRAPA
jgi:hypothetical protein